MAPKILIVLTSADKFVSKNKDFNGKPTGWYLPELAHPYDVLVGKAELVAASPKGGVAPLDQGSVEAFKEDESSVNFFKNHKDVWEKTLPLSQFVGKAAEFDAVFYPGGHGPLFDLVDDADSIKVIEEFYAAGKIVSAVCHGPIVFAYPKTADGKPIVAGRTVTGFTEEEEKLAGLTEAVPFSLEEKLKPAGANWVQADEPFHSKVVTDGKLITGQNPQSAKDVGEALAKALGI